MIEIFIKDQKLAYSGGHYYQLEYSISTALNGIGNRTESGKTPLGKHIICEKIGDAVPVGTVFQNRKNTGIISKIYQNQADYPFAYQAPCVTTRILRLQGVEEGINKGEGLDSFERCIYIHGTPYEYSIGKAVSKGCIRMNNEDIIDLFERVDVGAEVNIINASSEDESGFVRCPECNAVIYSLYGADAFVECQDCDHEFDIYE